MPTIRMERKPRGCGLRKKGGLYLFFDMMNVTVCTSLPMGLPERCPTCGEELVFFRSVKMINPKKYLQPVDRVCSPGCPVCTPPDSGAVMWVGKKFYSVDNFMAEALKMGISKRIMNIPKGLKPGDFVYFIHPEAVRDPENEDKRHPGIFLAARLSAFHKIIDDEQAQDQKMIEALEKQGITPVIEYDSNVPHDPEGQTTIVNTAGS